MGTSRKNFTLTPADLELIKEIQRRARKCDVSLNDSEVVRAAIASLIGLPEPQFNKRVKSVERLARGPRKLHNPPKP
jgi:hypothetical protein